MKNLKMLLATELSWQYYYFPIIYIYIENTKLTVEVRLEEFRLVSLNFTMLYRLVIQKGVQFNSLVGSCTILILGWIFTNPKMYIVFQFITFRFFECVQDDVGITIVEVAILIFIPVLNLDYIKRKKFRNVFLYFIIYLTWLVLKPFSLDTEWMLFQ